MPLHHQLIDIGARLRTATTTLAGYKLTLRTEGYDAAEAGPGAEFRECGWRALGLQDAEDITAYGGWRNYVDAGIKKKSA